MKSIKLTIVLLALLSFESGHAQTAEDYAAVSEFLPAEELSSAQENQARFAQFAYLNRHGYYLGNTGGKDFSTFPDISEVNAFYSGVPEISLQLIETGELNLMAYSFEMKRNAYNYYRVPGSDKVLVILPMNLSLQRINSEIK
ncbi:hypothetical protein G3O08_05080 [Cryomorpha ignava]|uniref:Uncharacterized protein n=1 Tax=Cryomorpha ignava TaxID=101383 RepID=A0A7K3WMJ6_9FLAO|nr:hypothetical protein [Cryomorpha ignava]NEN22869.1 hypothetical protein [Cryomorpha ignava]